MGCKLIPNSDYRHIVVVQIGQDKLVITNEPPRESRHPPPSTSRSTFPARDTPSLPFYSALNFEFCFRPLFQGDETSMM